MGRLDLPDRERDEDHQPEEERDEMFMTLMSAARYLGRCRRAGDRRSAREIFADMLSRDDAERICVALEAWPH